MLKRLKLAKTSLSILPWGSQIGVAFEDGGGRFVRAGAGQAAAMKTTADAKQRPHRHSLDQIPWVQPLPFLNNPP